MTERELKCFKNNTNNNNNNNNNLAIFLTLKFIFTPTSKDSLG